MDSAYMVLLWRGRHIFPAAPTKQKVELGLLCIEESYGPEEEVLAPEDALAPASVPTRLPASIVATSGPQEKLD